MNEKRLKAIRKELKNPNIKVEHIRKLKKEYNRLTQLKLELWDQQQLER